MRSASGWWRSPVQTSGPRSGGTTPYSSQGSTTGSSVAITGHGGGGAAPSVATIALTMVDVRETSTPQDGKPIHWRLLTTHAVTNPGEARRIVDLYRMRWTIEEFFHTLKTAGFNIEAADIGDPQVMVKFVAAANVAAVTVMQLVKARDGTTDQMLEEAFDPVDRPLLEALSHQLEGKTQRQKNPHAKGTLAYAVLLGCAIDSQEEARDTYSQCVDEALPG